MPFAIRDSVPLRSSNFLQHQPKGNNYNSKRHLMQHLYCDRVVALLSPTAEKVLCMWHLELTEMKAEVVVVTPLTFSIAGFSHCFVAFHGVLSLWCSCSTHPSGRPKRLFFVAKEFPPWSVMKCVFHVFLNRVQQTVPGNKPSQYPPNTIRWTLFRCSLRV